MKPTFWNEVNENHERLKGVSEDSGVDCPEGTVPIVRETSRSGDVARRFVPPYPLFNLSGVHIDAEAISRDKQEVTPRSYAHMGFKHIQAIPSNYMRYLLTKDRDCSLLDTVSNRSVCNCGSEWSQWNLSWSTRNPKRVGSVGREGRIHHFTDLDRGRL